MIFVWSNFRRIPVPPRPAHSPLSDTSIRAHAEDCVRLGIGWAFLIFFREVFKMNTTPVTSQQVAEDHSIDHTDKFALTEEDSLGISEDCVEYYDCCLGSNLEMIHGAIY